METITSKDGTTIAFERMGSSGPPLLLVDGALCSRAFGPMPKLAPVLAQRFTVLNYDRRGRGDSGDTVPYAKEREIRRFRRAHPSGRRLGVRGGPLVGRGASRSKPRLLD